MDQPENHLPHKAKGLNLIHGTRSKKIQACRMVGAHAFNPGTWEAEVGESLWVREASLVYRASSRTARASQREPVLKENRTK